MSHICGTIAFPKMLLDDSTASVAVIPYNSYGSCNGRKTMNVDKLPVSSDKSTLDGEQKEEVEKLLKDFFEKKADLIY